jgi:hypothetical protein
MSAAVGPSTIDGGPSVNEGAHVESGAKAAESRFAATLGSNLTRAFTTRSSYFGVPSSSPSKKQS